MGKKVIEQLFEESPPDILYHYTTQDGLLGIVNSGSIWATHTKYLNDSREFHYALDAVRDVLQSKIKISLDEERTEILNAMLDMLELVNSSAEAINIFVCSFSQVNDSLSQWRAYGGPTSGFALGFGGSALTAAALRHGFYLAKCIYEKSLQLGLISQLIEDLLQHELDRRRNDSIGFPRFNFIETLYRCAPVFKDVHYSAEEEWRLISSPLPSQSPNFNCRTGKSMLIPYYEISLTTGEVDGSTPLKEVVIGPTPHPAQSMESLRTLLWSRSIMGCQLTNSAVPYRNW